MRLFVAASHFVLFSSMALFYVILQIVFGTFLKQSAI